MISQSCLKYFSFGKIDGRKFTLINQLPSYHATDFGGGYVFCATGKLMSNRNFDSVHAQPCTKRHDGYSLLYRHLPDQERSDADALARHPWPGGGQGRHSFFSNPCAGKNRGCHPLILLLGVRFCKSSDIFSPYVCYRANPKSNEPVAATVF